VRIVVVGAGPAGVRVAELLRASAEVTLVGDEVALPYDRVRLSKLFEGAPVESLFLLRSGAGIRLMPATRAEKIDRAARVLRTARGDLPYDRLVLATGSQPVRLPLPGAGLPGLLAYRRLEDVRAMCRAEGPAVVIGGGLLGLECAAGLATRGLKVTVVHAAPWLMERQLDDGAAAMLAARLATRGVRVLAGAGTVGIEGTLHVERVRLADGTALPASLVVMAVGIRPEASLARNAGLAVQRGIVVDDALRTTDPNIFAIGECAEHQGRTIGLVAPALAQAEVAAEAILGRQAAYAPAPDVAALKVSGISAWSAGDISVPDQIVMEDASAETYRKLFVADGRLAGAVLYGDVADAPFYLRLIREARPIAKFRRLLPFGPALVEQAA
jgi:nitrite reductase (NADH) large subunit